MRRKLIQLTNIHLGPYARLEHSCDLPILLSLELPNGLDPSMRKNVFFLVE